MKFGAHGLIWTNAFTTDRIALVGKVKELGGEAIDIPYGNDEPLFDVKKMKEAISSFEMDATLAGNITAARDLTSNDKSIREAGVRYLKSCIRTAAQIGARKIIGPFHTELQKSMILDDEEKRKQWSYCVESLQKAAELAKQEGISICVEILNRFESYFMTTVQDGIKLVRNVGSENVKLLLDTFHMNIEEKDLPESIRAAGDTIGHFHACENDRGITGSGHIDWRGVAGALKEIGYDDIVVVESYNPDLPELAQRTCIFRRFAPDQETLVRESLVFLRQLFAV